MNKWKNERGSVTFYAIGLLGVTAILMFLLVNMIKIYATEHQASISAEQAAIAATDVIFDTVYDAVTDNGYIDDLEERKEDLEEQLDSEEELSAEAIAIILEEIAAIDDVLGFEADVEIEKNNLIDQGLYKNQAGMGAVDIVITEKLEKSWLTFNHSVYVGLRTKVQLALNDAINEVRTAGNQIVDRNSGETSESVIYMFNDENRIEVKTAAKYDESSYEGIFTRGTENIEQEAVGPSIKFIDQIQWAMSTIYLNTY